MQDKSNTERATSANTDSKLSPHTRKSVDSGCIFLAIAAVLLAAFPFVAFLLTRDLAVRVGSIVLVAIIATVLGLIYSGERRN
jgi:hypothetical protein